MRCPLWYRRFVVVSSLLLAASTLAACSSGDTEAAASTGPLQVTFTQTAITLQNQAGVPLVDVRLELEPVGIFPPFRASVPRIETGQSTNVAFRDFRSPDGTGFQPGRIRTRNVMISASDVTGESYEQQVPTP